MLAIQNRQYLSVITTTGADIHTSVTYRPSGNGRGHTLNKLTAITAAVATPGTAILGKFADATSPAAPDSGQISFEVENITIRNIDTTSQTVTVCIVEENDAGTQTVYQLIKETIATGQELVFSETGWELETHNVLGVWTTMIAPANVTNQTADVLGDVTGLTMAVLSGLVYEFKAVVPFTSGATTTGVRFTTNGPAVTFLNGNSRYPITATSFTENGFAAHQIPAAANADTLATGGLATLEGFIKPSADGTFAIQFASENNAQVVTALAGATLMMRRVL